MLQNSGEEVLFSKEVMKITFAFNFWQRNLKRHLVLTSEGIAFYRDDCSLSRKVDIEKLVAIVKQTNQSESNTENNEVVIIVNGNKDFHFAGLTPDEIAELQQKVQESFRSENKDEVLKIYAVPDQSLKPYVNYDSQYQYTNLPEEQYRLRDEEDGEEDDDEFDPIAQLAEIQKRESTMLSAVDEEDESGESVPIFNRQTIFIERSSEQIERENLKGMLHVKNINQEFSRLSKLVWRHSDVADDEQEVELKDFKVYENPIGKGTFGRVFRAKIRGKEDQKQEYAIKQVRKDKLIQMNQIENHIREQEILFQMKHQLLCNLHYSFQTDMNLFFVMPYIAGCTLKTKLINHNKFAEDTVKFIIAQIVIGLGHLHANGIVHRDLKLENIILCENGFIKLIDFGLATVLIPEEFSGELVGTAEYMAPEMLSQKYDVDSAKRLDWWAVGIIAYELLFSLTPFFEQNRREMDKRIKEEDVFWPN